MLLIILHVSTVASVTFFRESIIVWHNLQNSVKLLCRWRKWIMAYEQDQCTLCLPAVAAIHLWGPACCRHYTKAERFVSCRSTSKAWAARWVTGEAHKHIASSRFLSVQLRHRQCIKLLKCVEQNDESQRCVMELTIIFQCHLFYFSDTIY